MDCEIHEFWLRKYSERSGGGDERLPTYRVALGELIPAQQRQTFTPRWEDSVKNPDMWNNSGSVGFMDLAIGEEWVPKNEAQPYKDQFYLSEDCERVRALVIQIIGIEPQYRRMGYARFLKQRAEELALEWGLDIIMANMIENPIMREFNIKLGYVLYDKGVNAVKRLQPIH